ncbi:hypothetical protein DICPUDRAFT_150128 [Dictyostelium purpureum]|uniref:Uncharacterized protein n=1 Tax=Dictyostelium purpureum TaxID=5786 RepID=F0ZFI5_DICPU|nr:uncharacterized protein DICPUDRAFT_150128 [Dictyostelium purpureum]EGC37286.1 hypothetical protein DICPUDRAFT_150128 [Dictyostelium purpureum]|eukprot:XP_003286174.1 hypothetical protein DICPUDRAFT_150128 [Dictyostelium purpureum]
MGRKETSFVVLTFAPFLLKGLVKNSWLAINTKNIPNYIQNYVKLNSNWEE